MSSAGDDALETNLTDSVTTARLGQPALTVILPTIDNYQRIKKTLAHLQAQTARSEIEVLIVASSEEALRLDPAAAEGFFDLRVIEVGEIQSLAAAKSLAAAEARADWVVFGEDHSWPEPGWAEALIAAHREGYAVVGPIIRNANPGSTLSWTNYLACFSRWSHTGLAGKVSQTPWHNSSYRRELLLERQANLPRLLAVEGILQDEMREEGHRLYLLPGVATDHVNISRLSAWILQAFWGGKLYGGSRIEGEEWGVFRRLAYICGMPLIPMLRFKRLLPEIRPLTRQHSLMPRILPALVLNLIIHAVGEVTGYALGKGDAEDQYLEFEARRFEAITRQDRDALGIELPQPDSLES